MSKVGDRLLARYLGLTPPRNGQSVTANIRVRMRDGVELVTDHYAPDTAADSPTILIRSPYGRRYPLPPFYARPLAARGFHVVVQSVRGTYGSGGEFQPAIHEAADGHDTVAWLRDQPWFSGRLATIGASYLGLVQWALMLEAPSELRAAVILAAPHDLSSAWATGAFALDDQMRFAHGVAHPGDRARMSKRLKNFLTGQNFDDFSPDMPMTAAVRGALGEAAPLYDSWLAHPNRSDLFWDPQRFTEALNRCRVPVLLVNGWQDPFLSQTLDQYENLRSRGVEVGLTIGPWTHGRLLRKGARTFIAEAHDWLSTHVNDRDDTKRREPVRVFFTGHGWLESRAWPPKMPQRKLFLTHDARLTDEAPSSASLSTFAFDPEHPTPTVGGPLLVDGGYRDDTALSQRSDVLQYTTAALEADLYVAGPPSVVVTHSADSSYVDLFVRMSEVDNSGQTTNVSEGYRRLDHLDSSQPKSIRIDLDHVAHRFPAGSRIRLYLAGGCHPRFARNNGTGEPDLTARRLAPTTHRVHYGQGDFSRLELPADHTPPRA